MSKTFIVCDPNIVQVGGHYLELAIRMLHAVESAGYRPVLMTNKNFSADIPEGWQVVPTFTAGFWGGSLPSLDRDVAFSRQDRAFLRLQYSRYGLAWEAVDQLKDLAHFNRDFPPASRFLKLVQEMSAIKALANAALVQSGANRLNPADIQDSKDRAARYDAQRSSIKSALAVLRGKSPLEKALLVSAARGGDQSEANALNELIAVSAQSDLFREQLDDALTCIPRDDDTVILYPTINFFQLRGIRDSIRSNPASRGLSHHVIMRRNLYPGYAGGFDAQEWNVHYARTAFALLNDLPAEADMHLYTDTNPLTYQYGLFNTSRFHTGPIPIEPDSDLYMLRAAPSGYALRNAALILSPFEGVEQSCSFIAQFESGIALHADPGQFRLAFVVKPGMHSLHGLEEAFANYGGRCSVEFMAEEAIDSIEPAGFDLIAMTGFPQSFEPLALHALEQACPLIVPAGSWLSKAMTWQASDYHEAKLEGCTESARAVISDLPWAQYDFQANRKTPLPGGNLGQISVRNGAATVCDLPVPEGARHLRLKIRTMQGAGASSLRLNAIVFFRPGEGQERIGRHDLVIPLQDSVESSFVLPVPEDGESLSVSLCNFVSPQDIYVTGFDLIWLAEGGADIACLPGGGVFPSLSGDFTNAWITPIANLLGQGQATRTSCLPWMDPVTLRSIVPVAERHMIVAYLGDARKEKGFHHLPVVARMLDAGPVHAPISFRIQLYHSSTYPESQCLEAAALLQHLSRDRVSLIPRSLESADYAREILRADAVIVPYNRENYIARSSGVFAEGLAAGIPVIVPMGTWMSSVLDGLSYDQHTAAIDPSMLVPRPAYDWGFYANNHVDIGGQTDKEASLPINGQNTTFLNLATPADADHLWITAHPEAAHFGSFVEFTISFQDKDRGGKDICIERRILGGEDCQAFSLLLALPKGCRFVWIGMRNAYASEFLTLKDLNLSFIRNGAIALAPTACGVTYSTGMSVGEERQNLKDAVVQLQRDFALYKHSALAAQPLWVDQHNAGRMIELIDRLRHREDRPNRLRFSGRDW